MAMRILCSGSNGFIGGHFVRLAIDRGSEVIGLDVLDYAADPDRHRGETNFTLVQQDIRRVYPGFADRLGSIDVIVHFAALSHVDASIHEGPIEFFDVNVLGTARMLTLARTLKARFIYVSTDEVTGDRNGLDPADENTMCKPSSPYSASKTGGEVAAFAWAKTYGLEVLAVRPCNTYGPFQHPEKLIPRTITYALSDRSAPIYGDGQQVREWMHVSDVVRGIWKIIERGRSGEIYCLAGQPQTNADVIRQISKSIVVRTESITDRPGHDRAYRQRGDKALRELIFEARIPLAQGLESTVTWYRENERWWRTMIERGGRW
jgi:dTDP-glucose 4,6-dehydratase